MNIIEEFKKNSDELIAKLERDFKEMNEKLNKTVEKANKNNEEMWLEEYRNSDDYRKKLAYYSYTNTWEEAEDDEDGSIRLEAYRYTKNWIKAENDEDEDIKEEAKINLALINK